MNDDGPAVRWQYGTLSFWAVAPEPVDYNGTPVVPSAPWDWPWQAVWRCGGQEVRYDEIGNRSLVGEKGEEGWEVVHVKVDRVSFRGPNVRYSGLVGPGGPVHHTAEIGREYFMKRLVRGR